MAQDSWAQHLISRSRRSATNASWTVAAVLVDNSSANTRRATCMLAASKEWKGERGGREQIWQADAVVGDSNRLYRLW